MLLLWHLLPRLPSNHSGSHSGFLSSVPNLFRQPALLLFGAAGILGSLVFSLLSNRYLTVLLIGVITCLMICLLLLLPLAPHNLSISLLCVIWFLAMTAVALSLQVKVLSMAQDTTDVAMALFLEFLISVLAQAPCWATRSAGS